MTTYTKSFHCPRNGEMTTIDECEYCPYIDNCDTYSTQKINIETAQHSSDDITFDS